MPEGDTTHRAARALHAALAGKALVAVRSPLPHLQDAGLAGRRVVAVEAKGKYLELHFDDGRTLLSHSLMRGSWHLYRPGESWSKPESRARVVLEADDVVAVCFNAPVLELSSGGRATARRSVAGLGPDVVADTFDLEEARRRFRARPELTIGEGLLRQQLASGIGNIYKSEALFDQRLDPFAAIERLADAELDGVLLAARRLMRANLDVRSRATRRASSGPRYWVYRRSGEQCLRCGALVRMRRQGEDARSTYYCPACQGVAG